MADTILSAVCRGYFPPPSHRRFAAALFPLYQPVKGQALDDGRCVKSAGGSMFTARRKSDGQTVTAYLVSKEHGPFKCPDCGDEVILKTGRRTVNHFAHVNPLACRQGSYRCNY